VIIVQYAAACRVLRRRPTLRIRDNLRRRWIAFGLFPHLGMLAKLAA
jgi:hypothetical protein